MKVMLSRLAFGLIILIISVGNSFSTDPKKAWTAYEAGDFATALRVFKNRDIIAKNMSSEDISKAEELTRECVRKKYKGC